MNNTKNQAIRILITNDDGIHAPGIAILESIAKNITDDVWVVAPDEEKSGAAHSISLSQPIRMRQLDERHFQVSGTPTDCVLMAVYEVLKDRRPTFVLSGINSGANLADDVSYSGTIAAAMEGTVLGMRSIAVSQLRGPNRQIDFSPCISHAPDLIAKLLQMDEWPSDSFFNINFPHAPPSTISEVKLTTQGQRPAGFFSIDSRTDTRLQPYFWIKVDYSDADADLEPETDRHAIAENAISVTPIKMNFTDVKWRNELQASLVL